jgi:uncharacterized protein YgiM (DUF1202 family)
MQLKHFWSKPLALTASISLAAIAFSPVAKAFSPAAKTQQPSASYQIAQARSCGVVVGATNGLNVRAKPNADSAIVDGLWNGQKVIVEDDDLEGWVAISGPCEGYVFGDYLDYC